MCCISLQLKQFADTYVGIKDKAKCTQFLQSVLARHAPL